MFAYSPVETENILYNPKYTFNNRGGSTSNRNQPSSSSCNNNYCTMLSVISDLQEREQHRKNLERFHEATLKRSQLKQELQRRHQLCAENERLRRERTEKHNALKKVEECNALRKFYELKSAQLKNPNLSPPNANPSLSSSSSSSSFASSKNSSKSKSSSIKQFQAAFKIHTFIKHFIEKRQTQRILASLIRLRSIQNRLSRLKSMNLKLGKLTFDPIHEDKVLPISANNKAFLMYKESILRVLDQLANEFSDEFYLIRERRQFIEGIANDMLRELDHERDTQYNNHIHEKDVVEGFVII